MIRTKYDEEMNELSNMKKKFAPTLKTEDTTDNVFLNIDNYTNNDINDMDDEKNKIKKINYLLPSIPIDKIETILKNNNLSIEEGIEKLKELTLSENSQKKLNKNIQNQYSNKLNNYNLKNDNNNNKFNCRKYIKNIPKKRTYNAISLRQNMIPQIQNNNNDIIPQKKGDASKNNIVNEPKIENNNIIQRPPPVDEKEKERQAERKKVELKTVDVVAKELLESRNEEELKEYLFNQLQLLDKKKRTDVQNSQIEEHIKKLVNDHVELRKCNIAVSRVLNKKIVENYSLDNKMKTLENEIKKVTQNICYHEYMGDLYNEQLKKFNQI